MFPGLARAHGGIDLRPAQNVSPSSRAPAQMGEPASGTSIETAYYGP